MEPNEKKRPKNDNHKQVKNLLSMVTLNFKFRVNI